LAQRAEGGLRITKGKGRSPSGAGPGERRSLTTRGCRSSTAALYLLLWHAHAPRTLTTRISFSTAVPTTCTPVIGAKQISATSRTQSLRPHSRGSSCCALLLVRCGRRWAGGAAQVPEAGEWAAATALAPTWTSASTFLVRILAEPARAYLPLRLSAGCRRLGVWSRAQPVRLDRWQAAGGRAAREAHHERSAPLSTMPCSYLGAMWRLRSVASRGGGGEGTCE